MSFSVKGLNGLHLYLHIIHFADTTTVNRHISPCSAKSDLKDYERGETPSGLVMLTLQRRLQTLNRNTYDAVFMSVRCEIFILMYFHRMILKEFLHFIQL